MDSAAGHIAGTPLTQLCKEKAFCEVAINSSCLTLFIQLIDVVLAHFSEMYTLPLRFEALPIGTNVPPARLMSLMRQWLHATYMCCCQKLDIPKTVKKPRY